MAEGFNNVVGTIKKQAYGFHDRDYLRLTLKDHPKRLPTAGPYMRSVFTSYLQ